MKFPLLSLALCLAVVPAKAEPQSAPAAFAEVLTAPTAPSLYSTLDREGKTSTLAAVVEAAAAADVVFLGENHDDPTAHALQRELLELLGKRYGKERRLVLSLEMVERDCQVVLDEYLAETITEKQFLAASRPWPNYATDYRPLIELARHHKWPVLAANVPGRYANLVSRRGRTALDNLSPTAQTWLAPLPFPVASRKYAEKFRAAMGHMGAAHATPAPAGAATASASSSSDSAVPAGVAPARPKAMPSLDNILDAQVLRDATMAHSLVTALKGHGAAPLLVHVNGNFHSEQHLGTVEFLQTYGPGTRSLVVTMISPAGFPALPSSTVGPLGDFIILTDPKLPRSR